MWKINRKKRILPAAVCMALLGGTVLGLTGPAWPVQAASLVDGSIDFQQGSASIIIQGQEGQTLAGKEFRIYQLLYAENSQSGESVQYTVNPAFAGALKTVVGGRLGTDPSAVTEYQILDYMQSLNNGQTEGAQAEQEEVGRYSDFRYFVEELRTEIVREQLEGLEVSVESTGENGQIVLGGLAYGYYLIDEVTDVADSSQAASLCMTDTANPEVTVQIKSDYPTEVKKTILEDDGEAGWNVIGDYEIGQTVPYKYEALVPDLYGYHTYYFAFHDLMDEALDFDSGSVAVEIRQGETVYTLGSEEYQVRTDTGEETFLIEIADLKAIVDREFDHSDEEGRNQYGQTVTVTYQAVLNEKAAADTGRPGFENHVYLEFSNNPDADGEGETGRTPWDTVVCFTYELDGLKMNEKELKLEGAEFRLYSDPECREEVYVRENPDGEGYIVVNRDSLGGSDHTGGTAPEDAAAIVSDAQGAFRVYGLDSGVYYLKEIQAPEGYRPLLDPIVLTITPTFAEDRTEYLEGDGATDKILRELAASADIRSFYDGEYIEEKGVQLETDADQGTVNLTVVNRTGSRLPATGNSAVLLLTAGGAAMMGTALLILARKRRNSLRS